MEVYYLSGAKLVTCLQCGGLQYLFTDRVTAAKAVVKHPRSNDEITT